MLRLDVHEASEATAFCGLVPDKLQTSLDFVTIA